LKLALELDKCKMRRRMRHHISEPKSLFIHLIISNIIANIKGFYQNHLSQEEVVDGD
jgi:hypothetical protein